jgi:hypothetical protein
MLKSTWFRCHTCGRWFKTLEQLMAHMMRERS